MSFLLGSPTRLRAYLADEQRLIEPKNKIAFFKKTGIVPITNLNKTTTTLFNKLIQIPTE